MALLPYAEEVQENFGQLQNKKLMETKVTHILAHTTAKAAFIIILTLFCSSIAPAKILSLTQITVLLFIKFHRCANEKSFHL